MAAKAGKPVKKRAALEEVEPVPIDKLALVRKMIEQCSASLSKEGAPKTAVSDLIRLLALEKELADDQTYREIRVKWVESQETESVA